MEFFLALIIFIYVLWKLSNYGKKSNTQENNINIVIEQSNANSYPDFFPIELINLYEREKYDNMRGYLQQLAYEIVKDKYSEQEKKQFKDAMIYFSSRDPLLEEMMTILYPVIQNNEGILQSNIYSYVPQYSKEWVRYVLYFSYELGTIDRVKKGRSYQLYSKHIAISS